MKTQNRMIVMFVCCLMSFLSFEVEAQTGEVKETTVAPVEAQAETVVQNSEKETLTKPVEATPFRLSQALNLPGWIRFRIEQRSRYEYLSNQVRGTGGLAHGLVLRSLLTTEIGSKNVFVGGEFQDSRAYLNDNTVLNTGIVNPVELLQAYLNFHHDGVFSDSDAFQLRGGRVTIDLGSRRLLARNAFRNTINAFTGVDSQWSDGNVGKIKLIAVLPVNRLPIDPLELAGNSIDFDEENFDTKFWVLSYETPHPIVGMDLQVYVLGLHEKDGDFETKNRQLYTPGLRLLKKPHSGEFDGDVELVGQVGKSRSSAAPTDVTELDHQAWFVHAGSGYTFGSPWKPRVLLEFDAASGDKDSTDSKNQSFDTLYGARRFEYGPTGIYGMIARSNMLSPGLKIEAAPNRSVDMFVSYRPVWVMSDTDAWSGTGFRVATGTGNHFLGNQIEWRARWHIIPKNILLDVGGAYFVQGNFAKAVNPNSTDPSVYLYSQIEFFL